MAGAIATAVVEVIPDFSKFDANLRRGVNAALKSVSAAAQTTEKEVVAEFDKAAKGASSALAGVGRGRPFVSIVSDAQAAGSAASGAFLTSAERSRAALGSVSDGSAFRGIGADAERAGLEVEASFDAAAEASDLALRRVGGVDAFAPAVESSRIAGAQIERNLSNSSGKIAGALAGVGKGAAIGVGAIGLAGGAIAAFGVKGAADLEQVRIAFNGLLGSAKASDDFVRRLQKFAAETPFEFKDLTKSTQQLLGLGQTADQAIATLTTVGNAAASIGGGKEEIDATVRALAQMSSAGKLNAQDLNQIAQALPGAFNKGVFLDQLAVKLGVTKEAVRDLADQGKIAADVAVPALLDSLNKAPGALGAMERQSKSLLGLFSTFKDNIGQTLTGAFEPLLPAAKDALKGLGDAIGPALAGLAPGLTSALTGLLQVIQPVFNGLIEIATPILTGLGDLFKVIGPIIGDTFRELGPEFKAFGTAIGRLLVAASPLIDLFLKVGAVALGAIIDVLVPVVNAIAALLPPIIQAVTPIFDALLPAIRQVASVLGKGLADAIIKITPDLIRLTEQLVAQLLPHLPELTDSMVALAVSLADLLVTLAPLLPPLLELVTKVFAESEIKNIEATAAIFTTLARGATNLAQAIRDLPENLRAIGAALQRFGQNARKALGDFVNDFQGGLGAIKRFVTGIPEALGGAVGAIGRFLGRIGSAIADGVRGIVRDIARLPGQVLAAIGNVLGASVNLLKTIFEQAVTFVLDFPINVVQGLQALPGLVVGVFKAAFGAAETAVKDVIRGIVIAFDTLVEGVRLAFNLAKDFVFGFFTRTGEILSGIPEAFGSVFRRAKDFVGEQVKAILDFVTGIPGGIRRIGTAMFDAGKGLIKSLLDGLGAIGGGALTFAANIANGIIGFINKSIIDGLNRLLHFKFDTKAFGTIHLDAPTIGQIPLIKAALGTVTAGPQLAVIGDNPGGREAVIPLNDRNRAAALAQSSGLLDLIGNRGSSGPLAVFHVTETTSARETAVEMTQRLGALASLSAR